MGATATGARNFLIAYNVNLNTADKSKANLIASKIRTSGTIVKDENGETVRDKNGTVQRIPGMYDKLQACLLYTSPSPRDLSTSRMPSSA